MKHGIYIKARRKDKNQEIVQLSTIVKTAS